MFGNVVHDGYLQYLLTHPMFDNRSLDIMAQADSSHPLQFHSFIDKILRLNKSSTCNSC